jgi:hypothetical protein
MDYKEHLCHCKKSKYMDIQCPYKRKEDSYFCGIHLKSVQKYIYSEVLHRNILDENGNMILFQKNKNEDEMIEKTYDVDKYTIYGSRDLFFSELFEKHYYLSIYTIRKSIRYLDLRVNTKQSRQYLYQDLKRIYDLEIYYKDDISKIIKIQSVMRMYLIYRMRLCKNDSDILTFENIFQIPSSNVYIYKDKNTSFRYCYDIRTLYNILQMPNPQCPYTGKEYTDNDKIRIVEDIDIYKKRGVIFELPQIEMTEEEKVEMYMIDIFHKINLLDNYTSHIWFKNLNRYQLIQLYQNAIDIWCYRIQLTKKERKKYVENGRAFRTSLYELENTSSLCSLQRKILNEFHRFLEEGKTREDKKLSCMWLLTALVEVSAEAREGLPFLIL